ncbi:hypothetical protein ACIA6D_23550 [Streptomyces cacaoi]
MAPNIPGWAHPYRDPSVWYADGGEDPAPDPEPGDPEPEPADGWAPPTREEWEEHQEKLRAASAEAANRRKWLKAAGYDPKTGNKLQPDPEPEPAAPVAKDAQAQGLSDADMKRAVEKAVTETQLKGVRQMRTFAVGFNKALSEAGWNGTRLDSLMRLLDLDDVDIDDGEITGLTEQLDTLKAEWPEFFKRVRATTSNPAGGSGQNGAPAAKVDTADKKPPAPEPKGWAETVAERVLRSQ